MADPQLIEQLAERIARRGLTAPAVILLEIFKPYSFIASQGLLLCQPLAGLLSLGGQVGAYADLLAERSNVDRLLACLEQGTPHKASR